MTQKAVGIATPDTATPYNALVASVSLRAATRIAAFVVALAITSMASAECGGRGAIDNQKLIFSGKVTAFHSEPGAFVVSFRVDRVWKGDLHKATTLIGIYAIESDVVPNPFKIGSTYLLANNAFSNEVWTAEDDRSNPGFAPAGAVVTLFGCGRDQSNVAGSLAHQGSPSSLASK